MIARKNATSQFQKLLGSAGYSAANPDPAIAWVSFKQYLAEPLEDDAGAMVEAAADRDGNFAFSLIRQSASNDEFFQYRLDLRCPTAEALAGINISEDIEGARLEQQFFRLERRREFHAVLAHPGPWTASHEESQLD